VKKPIKVINVFLGLGSEIFPEIDVWIDPIVRTGTYFLTKSPVYCIYPRYSRPSKTSLSLNKTCLQVDDRSCHAHNHRRQSWGLGGVATPRFGWGWGF